MPPKRPRTGGLGKGKGSAKAAPKSKGRGGGRVNAAAVAAAVGKDESPPPVPKPKSAPRRNKVPAAGPPVKKTIVGHGWHVEEAEEQGVRFFWKGKSTP
jgi:hypothetical protein